MFDTKAKHANKNKLILRTLLASDVGEQSTNQIRHVDSRKLKDRFDVSFFLNSLIMLTGAKVLLTECIQVKGFISIIEGLTKSRLSEMQVECSRVRQAV